MPRGPVADLKEKQRFFRLVDDDRMSVPRAAKEIGRHHDTCYRWLKERDAKLEREAEENPAPRHRHELDPRVLKTLSDFNLFREVFFARRPVPWINSAAEEIVGLLRDKRNDSLVDLNCPPGAGKTTLMHDLAVWLICGGGVDDPAQGRAIRIILGHEVASKAKHYVTRVRRSLERDIPFYDKTTKQRAALSIVKAFGRFKPDAKLGEPSLWRDDEFLVAQIDLDAYEKEPTVQAASREGGFLGERCDVYIWDDLATKRNSRSAEIAGSLAEWWEDEAEERLEPGGVGILVGQRLGPMDLHAHCIGRTRTNHLGEVEPVYHRIVFRDHIEELCANGGELAPGCVQWDGLNTGCLLDAKRLSWRKLLTKKAKPNYRTVYQQEDVDPDEVLVQPVWLEGGTDPDGFPAIGCYDRERRFWEFPGGNLVTYACVDPSASNFWAIEVWALDMTTDDRYLIYGERRQMRAGLDSGFLDYDPDTQKLVGAMQDLQQRSGELGHPIMAWVIEANAAHRYLLQTFAYQKFRRYWPQVKVFPHQTQKNKQDAEYGVDALLPMLYKRGKKRLPRRKGDLKALTYMATKEKELTRYPTHPTDDTVMCDWFGEVRMNEIRKLGKSLADIESDDGDFLPTRLRERV